MDRQTLRDRVHRYNERGVAGLPDRHGAFGAKRRFSPEQEAQVAEWVRKGPNLAEIGAAVASGAHAVPNIDAAGWHQIGGRLRVPDNIALLRLPPYAPEPKPVEKIWACLRGHKPSNRVLDTDDTIVDACCEAWAWLVAQPERVTSLGTREWTWVGQ